MRYVFDGQPSTFQAIGAPMCGLFPFIIMFLVTSIAMLRERTSGTLERLMSLPLAKTDLLAGYGIAFGLLAALQALVVCLVGFLLLGLHAPHGAWLIGLLAVGNAVLGMALGLFVSAFARTEFQAVQFMPAIIFPQLLLCGLFVDRHEMAGVLYGLSSALPLTYAYDALARATHPQRARRQGRARCRRDRRCDADRTRARRAHSAAADCMSGAPACGSALSGTVITGTGERRSSSVVTVPSASCSRECGFEPSTIARARWRSAASINAAAGSRSETSVSRSMSNSAQVAVEHQLIEDRAALLVALAAAAQRRGRHVLCSAGVHDHELAAREQLVCCPARGVARALAAVIAEHDARPARVAASGGSSGSCRRRLAVQGVQVGRQVLRGDLARRLPASACR